MKKISINFIFTVINPHKTLLEPLREIKSVWASGGVWSQD